MPLTPLRCPRSGSAEPRDALDLLARLVVAEERGAAFAIVLRRATCHKKDAKRKNGILVRAIKCIAQILAGVLASVGSAASNFITR